MAEQNKTEPIINTSEPKNDKFSIQRLLSRDAVILFLVSGIGYFGDFIYTAAYFAYFNIPGNFMVLNPTEIIGLALVILLFFFVTLYPFFNMAELFNERFLVWIKQNVSFTLLVLYLFTIIWLLIYWGIQEKIRIYLPLFVLFTFFFITSFGVKNKRISKITSSGKQFKGLLIFQKYPTYENIIRIIGFITFSLVTLWYLGDSSAIRQKNFYIINTTPECVVLYQTGNNAVCSPFDRDKKEVDQIYTLINLSSNNGYQLKREEVGPLKLKPLPTATPIPTNTPIVTPTQSVTPIR